MSTFEGKVLEQTVAVANQHKIEPEALLAVVEVESAGKSLEVDGKTPCLLFERHIFYRELKKAGANVAAAVMAGLANDSWQPKTQYKDQGTSQGRLNLFARARAVNEECAIRSCSWGVGQTMGFLAEELKFKNAKMMFAYMVDGGVPAQVECMVREIENKKLTPKLNGHEWAAFAKVYNGPGYAENHYDVKMAAAWSGWRARGVPKDPVASKPLTPIETRPSGPVVPAQTAPKKTGAGAVIVAGGGAVIAAKSGAGPGVIAFGIFIFVLAVITVFILYQKRQAQKEQLGVLSTTDATGE